MIFCLILLGSLFKIDHWSIFKRDPSSIKQTDRFSSENQAESSRIVRVSRCRSMWRRGGRKPAGRIRPGSDFIYTKNFAWPGSDFIGGRCDRKSQFSKGKTAFAGYKNLTIVWLKAFHIQMCVYVCVNVYNMCIVCVCVRMCERACACALCVCMCVYVCILF